ncbi:MAG: molybdopterin-guanine dinucleotide biosynthesis protein MobA, partial [Pseudomonadota bacterium]
KEIMEKDAGRDGQAAVHRLDGHNDPELGGDTGREERKPSVNERLKDVLNKPRERLVSENEREAEKDREAEKEREIDREIDRDPGLSH